MSLFDSSRRVKLTEERDRVRRQIEILRSDTSQNYLPGMSGPNNRNLIADLIVVLDKLNTDLARLDGHDV